MRQIFYKNIFDKDYVFIKEDDIILYNIIYFNKKSKNRSNKTPH